MNFYFAILFVSFSLLNLTSAHLDPEIDMRVPEIIRHWGYPVEVHHVTTADGYILELHRIPHGRAGAMSGPKKVVFMQHGLECSSSIWVTNLPHQSAGFVFADAGYDVWLGNVRGNTYGKHHTTISAHHHSFWKFSWDEIAQYDLKAVIDYAIETSGQDKLYYIGHSQGTLTAFAKFSDDADWADSKINKFFALAPVARIGHIKAGLFRHLARYIDDIQLFFSFVGQWEFLPSSLFTDIIAKLVCGLFNTNPLCANILFLIAGPDSHQLNYTRIPVYVAHTPAGTSTQNMIHFGQMTAHNKFQKYDFMSARKNTEHYGQPTPPLYNVRPMRVETYVYWGTKDWLADPTDVDWLLPQIVNLKASVQLRDFNHMDFIWGERAAEELYQPIIDVIQSDG